MVPREVFRKFGKLGMTFFSFLSAKEEGHTGEPQLVVAVLTALTQTWLSSRELWERTGLALQAPLLLKHLHSVFLARGKMGRKPPPASLATAHMHKWS